MSNPSTAFAAGPPVLDRRPEFEAETQLLRELAECRQRIADGNPRPSDPARCDEIRAGFVAQFKPFLWGVVRRWRNRGDLTHDDLFQEAVCGLLHAIDRHDPDRGASLLSHAMWCVRSHVGRAVLATGFAVRRPGTVPTGADSLRSYRAVSASVSLDGPLPDDRPRELPAHDCGGTAAVDRGDQVGALLAVIDGDDREVVRLLFGIGGQPELNLSEAGAALGISKQRAHQRYDRAMRRLRRHASLSARHPGRYTPTPSSN